MELPILSLLETRVLGVLIEKELTVPDTYPLSLNALVAGCNQRSARDPVIAASEQDVQGAIDALRRLSLVVESSGGRVSRFAHNVPRVFGFNPAQAAILAALWLRGPQTPGELRIGTERLHRFADISAVEAYLEELAGGETPRVTRLPRQPGAREHRWAHLLSGPGETADSLPSGSTGAGDPTSIEVSELAALKARVAALELELERQRAILDRLCGELGVAGR